MSSSDRPKWWPISCTSTCWMTWPKRLVVLGPIQQDRCPVEPDHVRHLRRRCLGLKRQADALEQPEQVELARNAHRIQDLFGRVVVDLDHHAFAAVAEFLRQVPERLEARWPRTRRATALSAAARPADRAGSRRRRRRNGGLSFAANPARWRGLEAAAAGQKGRRRGGDAGACRHANARDVCRN